MLKRNALWLIPITLVLQTSLVGRAVQERFIQPLTDDKRIMHVLNRLTFGPRTIDIEQIREVGVTAWIARQIHPEQISESPALEAKLSTLDTLNREPFDILQQQSAAGSMSAMSFQDYMFLSDGTVALKDLLRPDQVQTVLNGSPEERQRLLVSLDSNRYVQVASLLPEEVLKSSPDLRQQKERAETYLQERREEVRRQYRLLNPALSDLLNPGQIAVALQGSQEDRAELFGRLDPTTKARVARLLPLERLAGFPSMRRERRTNMRELVSGDLRDAKLYRALYSDRQLEEVLVDFWFNHFNVDIDKLEIFPYLPSYEREAIRPHVLGHFKEMLAATARHPAMLIYLDNVASMSPEVFQPGPNMTVSMDGSRGLNENYARELMELHTLGVDGGYTQEDVIQVARCFTGWSLRNVEGRRELVFVPWAHDTHDKVVLGQRIPSSGPDEVAQVIDILARHPSTARHIARRLAQRFVADDPPQSLVDRMARTFTATDGDLRAVMETMLGSTEFFSEGAWQSKYKSPLELTLSAVRAVGGDVSDPFALSQWIADMGQPLYNKLEPTGYPNTGEAWMSTAGLIDRLGFATMLTSDQIPGIAFDRTRAVSTDPIVTLRDILGHDPSPELRAAIRANIGSQADPRKFLAEIAISSPDFQRK